MIARFFPCFKGAFGKISTIFLAYQLRQQKAGKFKNKRHKAAIKTSDRSGETEGLQRATADFVRFHALWNYAQDQYGSKTNSANREKGQLC